MKSDHGASFETIDSPSDVLKLAARGGALDLGRRVRCRSPTGWPPTGARRSWRSGPASTPCVTPGIPLAMRYKTTHLGTQLPERWGLPDELRDDTGVIFASAFPGIEEFAADVACLRSRPDPTRGAGRAGGDPDPASADVDGADMALDEIDRRIARPRQVDRRRARTASTVASCSTSCRWATPSSLTSSAPEARTRRSTRHVPAPPRPWRSPRTGIRAGRCRRVVVIAADDVTSDELLGWFGSGFLASGSGGHRRRCRPRQRSRSTAAATG